MVSKFDLPRDNLIIHAISQAGCSNYIKEGTLLRNLRLKNNLTIKQLSKEVNISDTTLMHVE